jgi:hypothetical protein
MMAKNSKVETVNDPDMKAAADEAAATTSTASIGNPDYEVEEPALPAVVKNENRAITGPATGLSIEGLQDVPVNIIPVPFVRVVQGQSKKIVLATPIKDAAGNDVTEAPEGTFYFNDIQECFRQLSFVMLRAKQQIVEFERDGEKKPTRQMLILGITTDTKKLFILALSVMSFSNFGRLMARFKEKKVSRAWEYEIIATSEKQENDKGKFWVQNFKIGEKLNNDQLDEMEQVYSEYGGALERQEEQAPEEQ